MVWSFCEYAERGCFGARKVDVFEKYCSENPGKCPVRGLVEEEVISLDDLRTQDDFERIKQLAEGDIGNLR